MTIDGAGLPRPPRSVPVPVRLQVLFGGTVAVIGWLFAAFGSVFLWAFVPQADLSFVRFRGAIGHGEGQVVSTSATSASQNKRPVWAIRYRFTDPAGTERTGTSYRDGQGPQAGAAVAVEFLEADPAVSRIEGLRMAPFDGLVLMVGLFPAIGVAMASFGLRRGVTGNRLLADGVFGVGTLRRKEATNTRINKRTVYELTFGFTAEDGREHSVIERTHEPEHLQDEREELLLYDPLDPSRAALIDNLPGRPRVDLDDGSIHASSTFGFAVVLLPAAFVAVNAAGAWLTAS